MARRAEAKKTVEAAAEDRHHISLRKAAEKFRRAREEAGLSLRELGEKAGLAPSTILKVERSQVIPSLAVCIRLADALNRKISYFVEEEDATEDVRFVPRNRGRRASPRGSRVVSEVVAEPLVNPRMEAFLLTIAPGGESGREAPIVYRGEEIVFGLKGRVHFEIRGSRYVVGPGDTLHFKGDIPHRWENPGPGEARILMVCAFGYER
ncbi:MAG: cupin [Candidatus Binatia bacterium]|nr:MAG: cupin [Candidatus Binatia bacterium]